MKINKKITNLEDVKSFRGHCGEVRTLVKNDEVTIHHVEIRDTKLHKHPMTEYYQVLDGSGKMILGCQTHEIKEGDNITIPAGTFHRAIPGKDGLKVYIVMMSTPEGEDDHVFG